MSDHVASANLSKTTNLSDAATPSDVTISLVATNPSDVTNSNPHLNASEFNDVVMFDDQTNNIHFN